VTLSHKRSFDFIMTRTFMKIFKTSFVEIINECQFMFNFKKISEVVVDRKCRFLQRFADTDNLICQYFAETARNELLSLTSYSLLHSLNN